MHDPAGLTSSQIKDWTEKKLRPTQKRVLTVLTTWLEDYALLTEEPHIARRLTDFLSMIVEPPALALTARLILQSLERLVRIL
jgi:son of sevenless-like protein